MIPKEAANPEGANLFIDFMLRPDIAAMVTEQSGFNTTVEGALDMTKGIDKDLYRFTDEQLAKLKFSPNLSEEVMSIYYSILGRDCQQFNRKINDMAGTEVLSNVTSIISNII